MMCLRLSDGIKENMDIKETVCRCTEIKCMDVQENWMTQMSKTDGSDQMHASYKDSVTLQQENFE